MRYRRLGEPGQELPVACTDEGVFDLRPLTDDIDGAFLAGVRPEVVAGEIDSGRLPAVEPGGLRVGAPIARPGKVVCVGLNYRDHARRHLDGDARRGGGTGARRRGQGREVGAARALPAAR